MKSTYSKIKTIASPITYVGLDNLKVHLGIYEDDGEDSYLSSLLLSAVDLVGNYIGQDLGSTVRQEYYSKFVTMLELKRTDTASLTVKYYNDSEVLTTIDSTKYVVDPSGATDIVKFKPDTVFPLDVSINIQNPLVVEYTSVLPSDEVQEVVIQAIYMFVTEMYENRGLSSDKKMHSLPLAAERLLSAYRTVRVS